MLIEKLYSNVTREKWERIKADAAAYGVEIESYTGHGETFGVSLRWTFTPGSQQLAIVILESTMFQAQDALKFVDQMVED